MEELDLIRASGYAAFPPRLDEQPIFYPVLLEAYAVQIARDWNTKHGQTGFVTEFDVEDDFLLRYPVQTVGQSGVHVELWVPAEELAEFNAHLVGPIRVTRAFRGDPPLEINVNG